MAVRDTICDAIDKRLVLSFTYKGRTRTVEPHILGYDEQGELMLSAWQLSGGSGVDFRHYHLRDISDLAQTGRHFRGARPGYNSHDPALAPVECKL